ncbi:MAG TPA: protease pro-enzyme activation domain-containing protein, partial [Candidatus Dormibacteraeota bacterium]|nr:protease pro-enzyme activation domain-containing protein [Candidatus Dormibacteraeota bacterium]
MREGLVDLEGSGRPLKAGAQRLRDVDPGARVEVTVTLRGPELPDPGLPGAEPLSRSDFASAYGASPSDAAAVSAALERFGLTIDEVSLAARSMRVSGTAAQMDAAFDAGLGVYSSADQGEFRGRHGNLGVPGDVAGIVTGVFGLDERRVARRAQAAAAPPAVTALRPANLEHRYSF